ncbi:MAG TPA: tRNA-dihydrouridine synthase family protein [Treponema sp.]|nr:tRNA-dihydrouridine synthase family protein [Treponema sp.]
MILYLAPMHGVTSWILRNVLFLHAPGFDRAIAPFILAASATRSKKNHFKDINPYQQASIPIEPQLLGSERDAFNESIKIITSLGYHEINLNMGCPYPMVAKKGRGSGLLPHPDIVARILDTLCSIEGIRVSVKVRLGLYECDEIMRLMPVLNNHPLSRVIIHPRVGKQMYQGSVDLEGFAQASELCAHEVVYNGDIFTKADFEAVSQRFPHIQSWMIGRGALMDPFLPGEIKTGKRPENSLELLRAFHDDLFDSYKNVLSGPGHLMDKMKEVWGYLGTSFSLPGGPLGRAGPPDISRAKNLEEYCAAVNQLFQR